MIRASVTVPMTTRDRAATFDPISGAATRSIGKEAPHRAETISSWMK